VTIHLHLASRLRINDIFSFPQISFILELFEKRVLRRIFGPKWDEIIWSWRKLHNGELHNICSLPKIIVMTKSRVL
jgi:hypothetical protein